MVLYIVIIYDVYEISNMNNEMINTLIYKVIVV